MITRVQVKNYRSLADVDVTLGPLTVLVGRNGAGKSTFVDVLEFVSDALRGGRGLAYALAARGGFESLSNRFSQGGEAPIEVSLDLAGSGEFTASLAFSVESGPEGHGIGYERAAYGPPHDRDEYAVAEGAWVKPPLNPFVGDSQERRPLLFAPDELAAHQLAIGLPRLAPLILLAVRSLVYDFIPDEIRKRSPRAAPLLQKSGWNLASVLHRMQQDGVGFHQVKAALRAVADDVTDLRVRDVEGYPVVELCHSAAGENQWFKLDKESDGTILMLAFLTALYQHDPIRGDLLIIMEEPERTLYADALDILYEVIEEASERHQIIITTQSPDLISKFRPNDLRVVEKVDGRTRIGPLDEVQIKIVNDELFSSGDLLRIQGLHPAMA